MNASPASPHESHVMGLFRWFTANWANTTEPTHPDLLPLTLPVPVAEAVRIVREKAAAVPRWAVAGEDGLTLRLTRTTPVARFIDDVVVTFTPAGAGTRVDAASRSRLGKGDFGQNRRNILELWRAVR